MDLSTLSAENKKLALRLLEMGRTDDARALINAYSGPRTGQPELGERGEILARGKQLGMTREDLFVPEESNFNKFVADMGAGFVDQGLGINQLVQHAIPGKNTADIDERVQEAAREYQQSGLADEFTGGRFTSNVIPALGGGILARGAVAARPFISGAVMGGAEEAVQPVTEDNYWTEKAKDVGIGAGLGLVTEGVPAGGIGATRGVVNAPGAAYRKIQEPGPEGGGWFRGDPDEVAANAATGERTGIDFTPGQVTQTPAVQQVEELARSGLFTQNRVSKADAARAGQYDDYIKGFRDSLGDDAPIDVVAPKIQAWGGERASELIETRHTQANQDYRPVQAYADGQPVIPADNYRHTLELMIQRGDRAGASTDQITAGKQAEERLGRLEAQGGKLTGADVEMLTRATDTKFSGSPFDVKDLSFGDQMAGEIRQAVSADVGEIADLDAMLKNAKRNYAVASSHIDEFENGLLGQVLGKSFESEVNGVLQNTKSPEALFQKFRTGSPTQIDAAMAHMDKVNPELANQFRASFLERAREGAKFKSAAGGTTDFDPATFLRNIGLTGSGEKGYQGYERLLAMFPENEQAVADLYRAGTILADATKRNTSNTAVSGAARESFEAVSAFVTGSIRKLMGTLGSFAGLRGVARSMEPNQGFRNPPGVIEWRPMYEAQELARIPVQAGVAASEVEDR